MTPAQHWTILHHHTKALNAQPPLVSGSPVMHTLTPYQGCLLKTVLDEAVSNGTMSAQLTVDQIMKRSGTGKKRRADVIDGLWMLCELGYLTKETRSHHVCQGDGKWVWRREPNVYTALLPPVAVEEFPTDTNKLISCGDRNLNFSKPPTRTRLTTIWELQQRFPNRVIAVEARPETPKQSRIILDLAYNEDHIERLNACLGSNYSDDKRGWSVPAYYARTVECILEEQSRWSKD